MGMVTVEDLLGHAKKKEKNRKFSIYVTELDKVIECTTITRAEYLDIIFSPYQDKDAEVLYNSCSLFKNDELIRNLKCESDPVQVVPKVLSHSSIYAITKAIVERSGLGEGNINKYMKVIEDDIKN